jgi:hypothetical protein
MDDEQPPPNGREPLSLYGMDAEEAIRQMFGSKPQAAEPAAAEIAEYVFYSAGAYRLQCRTTGCYSIGRVEPARHEPVTDEAKLRAAEQLMDGGWRFKNGPLCPECAKQANG